MAAASPSDMYQKGDRIKISGKPHEEGQGAGTIALVNPGPAYGIIFDGMEAMGIHKWYVGQELQPESVRASAFHLRGDHVQHTHGRRLSMATDGSHLSGSMIALMPTAEDAARLALRGGEAAADLHCTLYYLGPDAAVFDDASRGMLIDTVRMLCRELPPITSDIFGVAHWNGGTDTPSWVWSVGDGPEGPSLEAAHEMAEEAMLMNGDVMPEVPEQHTPWVAHICAAYTDDLTLAKTLEKRNGPVTFDRVRISFGDQDTDIPLTGGMTAAGELVRELTPIEQASRCDFHIMNQQWKNAVGSFMADYSKIFDEQRAEIRQQVTDLVDNGNIGALPNMTLDTAEAERLLFKTMALMAQKAGQEMQAEAERQGVTVPSWDLGLTASAAADNLRAIAKLTARNMARALVQSAAKAAAPLALARKAGSAVASAVDAVLKKLSRKSVEQAAGDAMSAAQNAGRVTVLEAAPPAAYTATEVLDGRTCGPCRQIDGKTFSNLSDAEATYPMGGYIDCEGRGNCRGTIVAVWDQGSTASATAPEGAAMPYHVTKSEQCGSGTPWAVIKDATGESKGCHATKAEADKHMAALYAAEGDRSAMAEELGGKPSKGTPKDRRMKANQYAYDGGCGSCGDLEKHFGSSNTISNDPWSGSTVGYSDAQWEEATAACDAGPQPVKTRCFLPHHNPGGALNRTGLGLAAGRFNQLKGHDTAAVARAKSHLRGHYTAIGDPVPDVLKATSEEVAAFALEDGYETITWAKTAQMKCPPGQGMNPDTGKCEPMECPPGMEMDPATGECSPMMDMSGLTAPWEGVLVVEDQWTGDQRKFAGDALTWPENPAPGEMPLRWNIEDSHGGTPTTKTVTVGRIDRVWKDGNKIMAKGVFDLGSPDGAEAYRRVKAGFLRGVSIDADDVTAADTEYVFPEGSGTGSEDGNVLDLLFPQPEGVIYHGGRIRAATLCDIPAFIEAYIALTDESGQVIAGGKTYPELVRTWLPTQPRRSALLAHAGPAWKPPAEWFENPQLSVPIGIQVTDDGRVYGHAAQWGSCHIGQTGVCVQPPREDRHPYFMTGELTADNGQRIAVGQITVHTGHAPTHLKATPATEHYDNTGYAVADVAVGNDSHGIWVAGAIRPGSDPALVHELRAAGQVSGDWRRIGGQLRLVGLLGVNVPGFPVPQMRARVASGEVQALVAAGQPTVSYGLSAAELKAQAYKIVMDDLFRQMTEGKD